MVDISHWTSALSAQKRLALPAKETFMVNVPGRSRAKRMGQVRTMDSTLIPVEIPREAIVELMRYAQARLAAGEGAHVLAALGADDPEFIAAYGLGYLPPGFQSVMPADVRAVLSGKLLGESIVVPAVDSQGVPSDVYALRCYAKGTVVRTLFTPMRGIAGTRIASAYHDPILTDSLRLAGNLFKQGHRNILFLRGVADVEANASRLFELGVDNTTVAFHQDAPRAVAALTAAGIAAQAIPFPKKPFNQLLLPTASNAPVQPPEQQAEKLCAAPDSSSGASSAPVFKGHDERTERASFQAGTATYKIETSRMVTARREVRLEHNGKSALDRFDLASEAQRKRFAISAALKTGVPFEQILEHLVPMLEQVRTLESAQATDDVPTSTVVLSTEERETALTLLRRPDLLDVLCTDLETLGWVGEEHNKHLLYLAATSRKLPNPLCIAQRAPSGAGKSFELERIAELLPPEDVIHVSRLTDSSLYYQGRDALRHKLLLIDEADALTPEVFVTLRVLYSRGALSQTRAERDGVSGRMQARHVEVRGPVAILTSTAGDMEEQFLSRCYSLSVDDSPQQTARILEAQRRLRSKQEFPRIKEQIVLRHRALQRVLEPHAVVIPFAHRIQFPAYNLRHRREQERFLNLIEASALLHQYQRLNDNGVIVASERDFQIAAALAGPLIARSADELSRHGRELLTLLQDKALRIFDTRDVAGLCPHWTRHQIRTGIDELQAFECIASPRRTRPRKYEVLPGAFLKGPESAIRLEAESSGLLAAFGESAFANTKPNTATG